MTGAQQRLHTHAPTKANPNINQHSHTNPRQQELVRSGHTDGLLVDVGAPAVHRGVAYNCRVLLLDRRVLLVRPKLHLANDGNYRETRCARGGAVGLLQGSWSWWWWCWW